MWLKLLEKVLIEIIPKIIAQIGKGNKRGFMAADDSGEIDAIRSGLSEALSMVEKGE